MTNMKVFIVLVIITAIFIGTALFRNSRDETRPPSDSSPLIIGNNAIYVADQSPSWTFTVTMVRFEKPGFVVVHEDAAGVPGGILGTSGLIPAGEMNNPVPITLSRLTRDGETLYAMLHLDDGDGVFDALKDTPALDPASALPMMMIVTVSAEATLPGAVSL